MSTNEPMTDGRLAEARAALDEDMSQWGGEYGLDLLAEVERLRARPTVDEDMVERAAIQMCATDRQGSVWAILFTEEKDDFRADARAALDAALSTGEDA